MLKALFFVSLDNQNICDAFNEEVLIARIKKNNERIAASGYFAHSSGRTVGETRM